MTDLVASGALGALGAKPSPTTLYRLFDTDDRLLYVGIAGNPGRRWEQHAGEKPWWGHVARTTLEHFDTRHEATAAETVAIRTENPVHNIAGRGGRTKKGHHAMAEPEPVVQPERVDRLSDVSEQPLDRRSLVGSFFHSEADPGWQGCVVAEPTPGIYLVELFSWGMGDSTHQRLVAIDAMRGWLFYDSAEWMVNAYERSVEQRWERERSQHDPGPTT